MKPLLPLTLSLAVILVAGCGKKDAPPLPTPGGAPPPVTGVSGTAPTPTAAEGVAPLPPLPTVSTTGESIDYAALNRALDAYCRKTQNNPISLDEVVAAGYLKSVPKLPPGKRFGINRDNYTVLVEDIPGWKDPNAATATGGVATPPPAPGAPPPPPK